MQEMYPIDEAVKHMEVPPDGPRGRGVPMAHPERIGYDSKENQQAYNSTTHGTPDNQIDTAKHFMKKGLKGKKLHKAVADHHDVIHADVHKQLTHDKKKLHPLHMSFVEEVDLDEASARADAMRAMRKDKSIDPADVDTDASDDDVKSASKNIIMQLRKSVSLRGNFKVEFMDKKKVKVSAKIAQGVQNKYNSMKKATDKEKFQSKISKSYKDMLSALKENYGNKQENTILDRVGKKLREIKNG